MPDSAPESTFVEHRTVYAGQVGAEDWLRLSADSAEVAAIVALPAAELPALVARQPDRVASGLQGSWPLYLRHKLAAVPAGRPGK